MIPGFIFATEILIRLSSRHITYVMKAKLLPSSVTYLVIQKPKELIHEPGDYVFVNIPMLSKTEWHPFAISSAPEKKG
jgi:predicted ferric reductase